MTVVHHGAMQEIIEVIESIADPLNVANVFLSMISALINCLHLLVLTRKSITSSATNVIMIGLAISDIFTLLLTVEKYYTLTDIENNECITSNHLYKVYIDMLAWALQDYFRRCSTWLGLSMATVRTLIVRNALNTGNSAVSKSFFGQVLVFIVYFCAALPSIFYYFRFQVLESSPLSLPVSCEEFQDLDEHPKYTLHLTDFFSRDNEIVERIFLMFDAVISKFLPCLCFPIFTILLIHALRKAKNTKNKAQSEEKNDPTTKLVIFMTVAFFLAEAPLGIIYMIRAFYHTNDGLIIASVDVIIVFACLLTVNSTCHFFFCLILSKQYRMTLLRLFGLDQYEIVRKTFLKRAPNHNFGKPPTQFHMMPDNEFGKQNNMAEISEMIETIANPLNTVNLYLSVISFFVNCFHLVILTRSSIHSTSTNWLMIGIAASDIFTVLLTIEKFFTLVDIERDQCLTSDSLWKMYIGLVVWALHDYFRRCSTWLALLMAIVRILIIRNALNKKLSKPSFGRFLVFLIFVLAAIPSTFYYIRFEVLENRKSPLPAGCEEFQDVHADYKYSLRLNSLFKFENQIVLRIYLMVDATLSKFLPCLLFPLCTFFLIRALHDTKKTNSVEKSDPTTKLVILMTVAFFVCEAPLGIILTIRAFFNRNDALITASVDVISIFTCLLTINSTCHFFICIFLSRQYRKTIKRLLGWEKIGRIIGISKNKTSRDNNKLTSFMVRTTRAQ